MPTVTEEDVLSALKSCYDPEIPVNIVDLGLIYKVNFAPVPPIPLNKPSRTSPST